jgi:hypothetical protein
MPIKVVGPDGAINEFDDGASDATIKATLNRIYGVKPPPPPKPAAPPPKDAMGMVSDYLADTFGKAVTGAGHQVAQDVREDFAHVSKPGNPMDPLGAGGFARLPKEAYDVAGAAMSPITGAYDAAIARPLAEGEHALEPSHPVATAEQGYMKGLMGIAGDGADAGLTEAVARSRPLPKAVETSPPIPKIEAPPKPPSARLATAAELKPLRERPLLTPGKPDEPIPDTLTRHEDGLYALQGGVEASKVEAKQALDRITVPPPQRQALYTAIEHRMIDPDAPIPPDLEPAFRQWEPLRKMEKGLFDEVKSLSPSAAKATGGEIDAPVADNPGFVHRVRLGKGSPFDAAIPGARQDPITGNLNRPGGKSLSKTTGTLKARTTFVLESPDGSRVFVPKELAEARKDMKAGDQLTANDGTVRTVKPATTEEIEANDPTAKYVKDPYVNTVDNIVRLQRVKQNIQYLNAAMPDLIDRDLAWKSEHHFKGDDGLWNVVKANSEKPEGFVNVPGLTGFDHVYFHPRIAAMFRDFVNMAPHEPLEKFLSDANRLMVGSMFWNPIKHELNMAAMWQVGRGWEWVTPKGWSSLLRNGQKAITAVTMQNSDYVRMLREGAPLEFSRAANADFYKMMIRKAGMEIQENPTGWDKIAKDFGLKGAKELVESFYHEANKSMWKIGDMLLMQRLYELRERGMDFGAAVKQAGKEIADYRVPTEAFGHRAVTNVLKNRGLVFAPYHYGIFKSYAAMARDAIKGTAAEKKDALGKLFALAVPAFVIAPIANYALRKATGNKDARVQGAGPYNYVERVIDLTQGQKEMGDVLGSMITLAPAAETAAEILEGGRDRYGRPLVEPGASPLGKAVETGEAAADKVSPLQTARSMAKPGGVAQQVASQVGIDLPSPQTVANRQKGKIYERRDAMRRERKDPVESAIARILGQ